MLAESLKRAFIIRKDDFVSRSDAGQLVPERLWKIGRTDDDKLFNKKKRSDDSEFVIDVLIDSSGSQAGRQAQVAAQGYIISEALSQGRNSSSGDRILCFLGIYSTSEISGL